MNHMSSGLAVLSMVLYQYHLVLRAHLTLVSRFRAEGLFPGGIGFALGVVCGAIAIDRLAPQRKSAAPSPSDRVGTARRPLPALLALPVFALLARFAVFDGWGAPTARFAVEIGEGLLLAAAHWVFFALVPRRWAAVVYCASLAGGFALAECQRSILFAWPADGLLEYHAVPFHRLVVFSTLLFSLVLAPGMVAALRREPSADADVAARPDGDGKVSARILLLIALFFLLHGLTNSAFLPFPSAGRFLCNIDTTTLLIVAFHGAGAWLFSRGFAKAFRLVVTICGVVYIAVPAFSVFTESVPALGAIHVLAGALVYPLVAAAMAALAAAAPTRWRTLFVSLPFALGTLEVMFIPHFLRDVPRGNEALPLATVLTAVAFYSLGQKIDLAAFDAGATPFLPKPEPSVPPESAKGPAMDDSRAALRRVVGELGATYGFSGRESEVAELLASGMSADAIGGRLGLATNTVHTYVRRVVIKTGRDGRKDFIGMVTRACAETPTPILNGRGAAEADPANPAGAFAPGRRPGTPDAED